MRLATVAQARRIDALASEEFNLPPAILMESAGALSAQEIALSYWLELSRGRTVVVCGPGHNGADGLVVARHLLAAGYRRVEVMLVGEASSALYQEQRARLESAGRKLILESEDARLASAALIIDALCGIGLKGQPREHLRQIIEQMNAAKAPKVSLDVPSGLNADTGEGPFAVRATLTIAFALAKPGFFVADGPSRVGRLRTLAIGIPRALARREARTHVLFTEREARRFLPKRLDASNKSSHGHALVIAGRPGFWGAGIMCSGAALRVGAGYVTWASETEPLEALKEAPEVLTAAVASEDLWQKKFSAVALGPGLGTGEVTAHLIERLKTFGLPVVLDADAITVCAQNSLWPLPPNWILTPHAGELARVIGGTAAEIERDRFAAVEAACAKTGAHVLLKGFRTVIGQATVPARTVVIHAGNAALAKAGTGDVLTGMIAGLLAQGLTTLAAASTAAYLHGRLADEWVRDGKDKISLNAGDLRELLPGLIARLR